MLQRVTPMERLDHCRKFAAAASARYRERRGRWRALVEAAGPDRLSGGHWEGGYAREYFRCVAEDGALQGSLLGMTFLETLSRYSVEGDRLELAD